MTEQNGAYEVIAEAIAEAFTSEFGDRNRAWDIDRPDGPDNEYHLRRGRT